MGRKQYVKIILDGYGDYLGMKKGCIIHRDKEGVDARALFQEFHQDLSLLQPSSQSLC